RRRLLEGAQHHDRRRAGRDERQGLPARPHGLRRGVRRGHRAVRPRAGARRAGPAGRLRLERPRRAEDLRREVVKRVLVTDGLDAVGVDALRKHGLEVDVAKPLPEPALVARIGEYEGLIVRSATRVTSAVLAAGARLEVVGRAGAGVDTIDVDAATERGVVVMNTPGGNTTAVAEHTLALLLALARRIPAADAALKGGRWEKSRLQGIELFGKVLGVLGLGRIGSEVARRALADAIRSGRVAGAALDVFEQEPPPPDHPLLGLEQVIVMPHLGAATDEAQTAVALAIAEQVADALLHGVVVNAVNLPSIDAETSREQAPWLGLAEKMGRFLAQRTEGRMREARLTYSGEIAGRPTATLTLALVRGLLGAILSERVTDVNALPVAKSRGLKVTETSTT